MAAEALAKFASMFADTTIGKTGGGAERFAVNVPSSRRELPSSLIHVTVITPLVPLQVPLYEKATSLSVPGLMEHVPSGLFVRLKLKFLKVPLPWMGPGTERSSPVITMESAQKMLLEQPACGTAAW